MEELVHVMTTEELLQQHKILYDEIQSYLLSDKKVYDYFLSLIDEKREKNRSLVRLSNFFKKDKKKETLNKINNCLHTSDWSKLPLDRGILLDLIPYVRTKSLKNIIDRRIDSIREIENILLQKHQYIAYTLAHKYKVPNLGIDIMDLVQEANKGILKAICKFDPSHKTKFQTFSYMKARNAIKEYLMYESRIINIPRTKLDRIFILLDVSNSEINVKHPSLLADLANKFLQKKLHRNLGKKETFTTEEVSQLISLLYSSTISLDIKIDGNKTIEDLLPDTQPTSEDVFLTQEKFSHMKNILENLLDPIEWQVLYYKYFFSGFEVPLTETKILLKQHTGLDYTEMRINMFKLSAFKKLRKEPLFKEFLQEK